MSKEQEKQQEQEKETYGFVTEIDRLTKEKRELEIKSFVRAKFKDHRLMTVSLLEDGNYLLCIENPESTGRSTQQIMKLSKESLVGLFTAITLFFNCSQESMLQMLQDSLDKKDEIMYEISDNLQHFDKEIV